MVTLGVELTEKLTFMKDNEVPYEEIRNRFHHFMDINTKSMHKTFFPTSLLSRGNYGYMLSHWFDYFPKQNFLIVDANDIKRKFLVFSS